ncbi:hypothetical protein [Streptomyces sp. NPDC003077]|uniref:hypothetical protein n=1 Tax=Streptomyces sp. NPDC003077 TaxID=3154443 RepID=UPI0033A62E50
MRFLSRPARPLSRWAADGTFVRTLRSAPVRADVAGELDRPTAVGSPVPAYQHAAGALKGGEQPAAGPLPGRADQQSPPGLRRAGPPAGTATRTGAGAITAKPLGDSGWAGITVLADCLSSISRATVPSPAAPCAAAR